GGTGLHPNGLLENLALSECARVGEPGVVRASLGFGSSCMLSPVVFWRMNMFARNRALSFSPFGLPLYVSVAFGLATACGDDGGKGDDDEDPRRPNTTSTVITATPTVTSQTIG